MGRSTRGRRSAIVAAIILVAIVAAGAVISRQDVLGQPNPLTVWNFEMANGNADAAGPVALLWSIETYNDTLSVEGPPGYAAPSAIRLALPSGEVLAEYPMVPLDPAVNVSVCPGRRPPKGASWWSRPVPSEMAKDLRERGTTAYRLEVLVRTEWRPVTLIDSGCRGVGRG